MRKFIASIGVGCFRFGLGICIGCVGFIVAMIGAISQLPFIFFPGLGMMISALAIFFLDMIFHVQSGWTDYP